MLALNLGKSISNPAFETDAAPLIFTFERLLLKSLKVNFGLGLFDVCPARDEGAGRASICGQTLNKPPGTKPRSAASRFG